MAEPVSPGGRGQRLGPDGVLNEDEARALRTGTRRYDGWILSNAPIHGTGSATAVGTANLLRLNVVEKKAFGFVLHDMLMHVLNAVVSATAQVGLYVFTANPILQFTLIPGTLISVDCSAFTVAPGAIKLARDVTIEPFAQVFVGTVFSDATTQVRLASAQIMPILKKALGVATLPNVVLRSELTLDEVEPTPYVYYRSVEASRVL